MDDLIAQYGQPSVTREWEYSPEDALATLYTFASGFEVFLCRLGQHQEILREDDPRFAEFRAAMLDGVYDVGGSN